jgi:hypothetical protein
MKSSVLRTLVTLSLSTVFSHVALLAQDRACATIPFDFSVGVTPLAAGKYCVRESQQILKIYDVEKGSAIMALTMAAEPTKVPGKVTLTFNRYGSSYFLSQVSDNNHGRKLMKSAPEKELIARASSPKPAVVTTILASK